MPKVKAPMSGLFKEILGDYLEICARETAQGAGRELGQKAGKEIVSEVAEKAAKESVDDVAEKALKEVKLPFKLSDRLKNYGDEMTRQLDRQLKAMDGLTPAELLDKLDNPAKRTGAAQREARQKMTEVMTKDQTRAARELLRKDPGAFAKQLDELGVDPSNLSRLQQVEELGKARSKYFMDSVAALHEPDIVAGGADEIGKIGNIFSLGESGVNSSLGSQWKNMRGELIDTLRDLPPNQPLRFTYDPW